MLYFGINCSLNYNQKIYNKAKAITKKKYIFNSRLV